MEVPVLKKRREVLPLEIATPGETAAIDATREEVSRLPLQTEEKESCLNSLNVNAGQWQQPASSTIHPASLSPCKSPPLDTQPKKKCVKLVDSPVSADALREQSGNTPRSPRSVCPST